MYVELGITRDSNPSANAQNYNTHFTNGLALTYTNTEDNMTINGREKEWVLKMP